ncbi:hypothetical protein [Halorussus lipolyticus]|nr:hypothetical protein [Halorussus sp. DT80]
MYALRTRPPSDDRANDARPDSTRENRPDAAPSVGELSELLASNAH